MARCRIYTIEFERRVAEEHLGGGTSLNRLARRHDVSRELLPTWVERYEAGELTGDGPAEADRQAYGARIAGPERKVGQLATSSTLPGDQPTRP